jgi:hypothetical protein
MLHFSPFYCVFDTHGNFKKARRTFHLCMNKNRWLVKEVPSKRYDGHTIIKFI